MTFPQPLEIALTRAEDASKRCRWIILILQLTVVLVLAGIWQQADSNWLQLRLNAAQSAVKLLTCAPIRPTEPRMDMARVQDRSCRDQNQVPGAQEVTLRGVSLRPATPLHFSHASG
jgi:hypothetical protein